MIPTDTSPFRAEEDRLQPVLTTSSREQLHLSSLVLSAADIPHTINTTDHGGWSVLVTASLATRAEEELASYERENRHWPPPRPPIDHFRPVFLAQSILIIAGLILFHTVTGPWTPQSHWFINGAVDSRQILDNGEYFRLITALTLHADLVHLLGNCVVGGFLLHFCFLLVGNGLGSFLLVCTSGLANYINVVAHGHDHHSVGFSTAIFVLVGILSALNYRQYRFSQPARLLLPLMAGAAMLAMLGSGDGDGRTDLGAHFFGLITGLGSGTLLGLEKIFRLRDNTLLQGALFIGSISIVLLSWQIALR